MEADAPRSKRPNSPAPTPALPLSPRDEGEGGRRAHIQAARSHGSPARTTPVIRLAFLGDVRVRHPVQEPLMKALNVSLVMREEVIDRVDHQTRHEEQQSEPFRQELAQQNQAPGRTRPRLTTVRAVPRRPLRLMLCSRLCPSQRRGSGNHEAGTLPIRNDMLADDPPAPSLLVTVAPHRGTPKQPDHPRRSFLALGTDRRAGPALFGFERGSPGTAGTGLNPATCT
jgi:hypothetical protein